jgi:hypothetical protein
MELHVQNCGSGEDTDPAIIYPVKLSFKCVSGKSHFGYQGFRELTIHWLPLRKLIEVIKKTKIMRESRTFSLLVAHTCALKRARQRWLPLLICHLSKDKRLHRRKSP